MIISKQGINFIKGWEKLRLKAYKDSGGKWTIGYGHTKDVCFKDKITEQEAEQFLKDDLFTREFYINSLSLGFKQNQYDAIVSLVFNIGIGAFGNSTILKKIKRNPNDLDIAGEFVRWHRDDGMEVLGLLRRRIDESKIYFT